MLEQCDKWRSQLKPQPRESDAVATCRETWGAREMLCRSSLLRRRMTKVEVHLASTRAARVSILDGYSLLNQEKRDGHRGRLLHQVLAPSYFVFFVSVSMRLPVLVSRAATSRSHPAALSLVSYVSKILRVSSRVDLTSASRLPDESSLG